MPLRVACQMDPIERIDIRGDSTFAILLEAQKRGHEIFYYTPQALALHGAELRARGHSLEVKDKAGDHYRLTQPRVENLAEWDVPPLGPAAREGARGLRRDVPREVHERHQRRDAAALCADVEPRPLATHHEAIGDGWVSNLERLRGLEAYADDAEFRERFAAVKSANSERFATVLRERDGLELAEGGMVDAMVKRLHEYKRQSLKVLHIVSLYETSPRAR